MRAALAELHSPRSIAWPCEADGSATGRYTGAGGCLTGVDVVGGYVTGVDIVGGYVTGVDIVGGYATGRGVKTGCGGAVGGGGGGGRVGEIGVKPAPDASIDCLTISTTCAPTDDGGGRTGWTARLWSRVPVNPKMELSK